MSRLDEFLPEYDARERHERRVRGTPELAVAAALGIPVAPDGLVRTLFRLRGLPGGGSVQGALRAIGLCAARRGAGRASCSAPPAGRGRRARGSTRSTRPGRDRCGSSSTSPRRRDGDGIAARDRDARRRDGRARRGARSARTGSRSARSRRSSAGAGSRPRSGRFVDGDRARAACRRSCSAR